MGECEFLRGHPQLVPAPSLPKNLQPGAGYCRRSQRCTVGTVVAKDSPVDAVKSFSYSDGFFTSIDRGEEGQTIILDMKGEAASIGVGFPNPKAQKVVDTVKWGGS